MFVEILNDTAARQDRDESLMLKIQVTKNYGKMCDFFGSKMTMDEILAHLGTGVNSGDY